MTQYLITTFTDSSGMQHKHVAKLKDNQTATVVNADSKEEAERKYNERIEIKKGKSFAHYGDIGDVHK
ncbi:DUF1381 domain-containing protein [Staphylococcus epidermidis]|uniref:DUF1381 domain-containing protein n=1 Tax=Staphylococcus epidermidis TaxID=1282 RepID=UPI00119E377A|nr:DUF1381 domain-containing protein [Staphylococcus epidermidis]